MQRFVLDGGVVDLAARVIDREDGRQPLTPIEAELLQFLMERAGTAVSHAELLAEVWDYDDNVQTRTVYTTVTRLRAKVEQDVAQPRHIVAVRGVGYRFEWGQPRPGPELIGRQDLLHQLSEHLDAGVTTLTGPPGIGKTTLARALVHRSGWMCALARARTSDEVAAAVGQALSVSFAEDDDLLAVVGARLARLGPAIVVLDNCEQAVEAVAACLHRWRQAAPTVRFVATSRQPLGLSDERIEAVPPMPTDAAVALFRQRARGRQLEGDEAIARVVALVEGIPLAIELAAGLVDLLSPAELARRLEQGHDVLDVRPVRRDGVPVTLSEAIATSWELLTADEQQLLARCALFRSWFDLDAVETIYGKAALVPLAGLTAKSLMVTETRGEQTHYRLLEAIRSMARGKLGDAQDEATDRHAAWVLQAAGDVIDAGLDADGLRLLLALRDDLVCAFEASEGPRKASLGFVLDDLLAHHVVPGIRLRVLDATVAAAEGPERGLALLRRSRLHRLHHRRQQAQADIDAAEGLAPPGMVLRGQGALHIVFFELEPALSFLERAEPLLADDPLELAELWVTKADALRFGGHVAEARPCLERAVARFRLAVRHLALARALGSLGQTAWALGDSEAALSHITEACDLFESLGNQRAAGVTRVLLGYFQLGLGRVAAAKAALPHIEAALVEAPTTFQRMPRLLEAWCHAEEGSYEAARACFRLAEALCREAGDVGNLAQIRLGLALLRFVEGSTEEALAMLEEATEENPEGQKMRPRLVALALRHREVAASWPEAVSDRDLPVLWSCQAFVDHNDRDRLRARISQHPESRSPELRLLRKVLAL